MFAFIRSNLKTEMKWPIVFFLLTGRQQAVFIRLTPKQHLQVLTNALNEFYSKFVEQNHCPVDDFALATRAPPRATKQNSHYCSVKGVGEIKNDHFSL